MANLRQEKHIELVSGTQERFVITNSMTAASLPSQLPHLNIFVITIVTRDDPKDDAFARVARVSDLSLLSIGRDAGLASGTGTGIEYLSASAVTSYTTLTDAILAATAIKDRVNAIITDWIKFSTQFVAPDPTPANYTLPTMDASQLTALIAVYRAAKHDGYQKLQDSTAANAAYTQALADYTYKQNLVAGALALQAQVTTVVAEVAAGKLSFESLLDAGNAFYAAASGTPPSSGQKTTFLAALTTATQYDTVQIATQVLDTTSLAAGAASLVSNRTADGTAAAAIVTTTTADKITKTQALASASTTLANTLAAVLAVCPDFDKTTVAWVDDDGSISV